MNKPRGFLNAKKRPLVYHCDIVVFYRRQCVYHPQMTTGHAPIHACKRKATSVNYGHADGGQNVRAGATDRYPGSVIEFAVVNAEDKDKFHPTQKPVDLCAYLVATFTDPGDLVLDPCAGSATTGVAALQAGRRFVGFEITPDYHQRAVDRLASVVASPLPSSSSPPSSSSSTATLSESTHPTESQNDGKRPAAKRAKRRERPGKEEKDTDGQTHPSPV